MGLWGSLVGRASDFVLYSPMVKRLAVRALNTPLTRNPVYRYAYKRQMKRVMRRCREVPLHIMIENTNACNLRCIHCPHDKMKRGVGFMDMGLYRKIVDECVKFGISHVDIHQFGEPLLDRLFLERVRYAKAGGIPFVTTNTNGIPLTRDLAEDLIKAGIDQVIVSIDAATPKTYEKVRPPGRLEVVEENVRRLLSLRSVSGSRKPRVIVDFVQMSENIRETRLFIKKWRGVADDVCVSYVHDWASSVDKRIKEFHGSSNREPCRLIWTDMAVSWDGRVPLCCVDYENEVVLGDVRNETIAEVWGGRKLRRIRGAHLNNRFGEVTLCARCSYRSTWWISK